MIQSALHVLYPAEFFTHSERMRVTHAKFSTGFWSQSLCQKPTQNERIFETLADLQRQNVCFLAQTLTSEARTKFSMCRSHTF